MNDKFTMSEIMPIAVQMEAYNRLSKALLDNFLEEMDEEVVEYRLFQSLADSQYDEYYQQWKERKDNA